MNRKGFTLIELLIVIAIIGILAGVFFIGVTGFRNSALDARRVADLKNVQNSLELYYSKCRLYPNTLSNSATCPVPNSGTETLSGSALNTALTTAGIGITAVPTDPTGGSYQYAVEGAVGGSQGGQKYVLAATLSGDRDVLRDPGTITGTPFGNMPFSCYPTSPTVYCVGTR